MANAGFSAVVDYFGPIAGLKAKSSSDGASSSFAECQDGKGDTVATDVYGEVIAPSTEYAVEGTVDLAALKLGKIFTVGNKKVMLTAVEVSTGAATNPTVSMSGVEVEAGATDKRTYNLLGSLTPRTRSQDVASALVANEALTQINASFSIDPHVETVSGVPVASDCSHGRVEVSATMADYTGEMEIEAATGFDVSSAAAASHPDAGYIERSATLFKNLVGTDAAS